MFDGFAPPIRNYFAMPNEWTDITAGIDSLAELKVVEYVLRHTWGFHEFGIAKTISIDEFMHGRKRVDGSRMDKGTGLKSDRSVRDGLTLAIKDGYLICVEDNSDKARMKKSYKLKMRGGVVESTTPVDSTSGSNYQSAPTILPVKAVESTSRSEKETREKYLKKEREKLPTSQPNSLSLSQKSSSFLGQLTDVQSDFWTRWCAIAGAQELNETAHKHVVALASKVTTTQDLQSLYDYTYDRLRELAQAAGKEPVPPRLGNLVKVEPEWSQAQARKRQEKEQDRAAHGHVPGSGSITNWTQARIAGNQPPINYDPLPTVKPASGLSQVGNISAGLQERIRQARERRDKKG